VRSNFLLLQEPGGAPHQAARRPYSRGESNKYYIHTGPHVSGLPCLIEDGVAEAPFAVYQTDRETWLFATGPFHGQLEAVGPRLKFRDKAILLDTFAIPSLARDTAIYRREPRRLFYARMSRGRRL